ncbi:DUF7946 domain-containing protein [Magnetospirillum molischianum]|uniref:Uncharacterized protein n=1 Tax=Magnetospirillum molischianum DSM 120 TaxID=1150626 RepID=H8FNS3_MAGML|nr:hypothetical protein [Magnetospirillum molischianum]CCG40011.1 conserved hypothetical protein [Magnetospirillum molischianum DSM 120]
MMLLRHSLGSSDPLPLTTHLVLNGTIITEAPSLKGAKILALPAEPGSWKFIATVVAGIYALGQTPQNSVLGHLMTSAYDYVVSETLGFHVDFAKTLGQQYEEAKKLNIDVKPQDQERFDAVIEKCELSIKKMHRPIIISESAKTATITPTIYGRAAPFSSALNFETFEYIDITERSSNPVDIYGRVSSYNSNTYKGRIFVPDEGRPIPFELADSARDIKSVGLIAQSLVANAISRDGSGFFFCRGFRNISRSGRLKGYLIIDVQLESIFL